MITITKIDANTYNFKDEEKDIVILTDKDVVLEKKTGAYWLKLPENSCNRKLINIKKFDKNDTIIIDTYKESIKISERKSTKWEDYLTDEEKEVVSEAERTYYEIIDEYKKIALERKEADKKKPMTKEDKIRAQIEKYQKMLEKLEAEG